MVCTKMKTSSDGRATIEEYPKDRERTRADAEIKLKKKKKSPSGFCAHAFHVTPPALVCRSKERDTEINNPSYKKRKLSIPCKKPLHHRNNSNKINNIQVQSGVTQRWSFRRAKDYHLQTLCAFR